MHRKYVLVHLLQQFIDLDRVDALVWAQAVIASVVPAMSPRWRRELDHKQKQHAPGKQTAHILDKPRHALGQLVLRALPIPWRTLVARPCPLRC